MFAIDSTIGIVDPRKGGKSSSPLVEMTRGCSLRPPKNPETGGDSFSDNISSFECAPRRRNPVGEELSCGGKAVDGELRNQCAATERSGRYEMLSGPTIEARDGANKCFEGEKGGIAAPTSLVMEVR